MVEHLLVVDSAGDVQIVDDGVDEVGPSQVAVSSVQGIDIVDSTYFDELFEQFGSPLVVQLGNNVL